LDTGKTSYEKLIEKTANDAVKEIENGGNSPKKSRVKWLLGIALLAIVIAIGFVCYHISLKKTGTVTHAFVKNVNDICEGVPGTWIDIGVRENKTSAHSNKDYHDHVFICAPSYEIEVFPETKKWCPTGGRTIEILPGEDFQKSLSIKRVSRHVCDLNPDIPNSKAISELHEIQPGNKICSPSDLGISWKMYYLDEDGNIAPNTTQYINMCHKFIAHTETENSHQDTFRLYDESAGPNCAIGGLRAELATDNCRHGLLGEDDVTFYICDLAGPVTPPGSAFEVHLITDILDKNKCPNGGWLIEMGSAGINGSLNRSNPVKTKTLCNPIMESKHNYLKRCDDE